MTTRGQGSSRCWARWKIPPRRRIQASRNSDFKEQDALAHDINAGVASGAISSKTGKSLSDDVNQALAASSAGQSDQAANAVAAMNGTIDRDVQAGNMSQSEANTLLSDVSTLATALGVPNQTAPANTPTTAAPPQGGGGPGNGNGH